VSWAEPISAPQSISLLITSPSFLTCPFLSALFKTSPGKSFEICNTRRHRLGWVGPGRRAVRVSSRAGSDPPGFLHNFLGYFKLSGKSGHWSAAGATSGRGGRPFSTQARLQRMEKLFCINYSPLLSPRLGSEMLDTRGRGGGKATQNTNPERLPIVFLWCAVEREYWRSC